MLITKEFERELVVALKEAINDAAPDLFDDLTRDNPEFWANQLNTIFKKQVKLALQDKRLLREILIQIIDEQYCFEDILRDAINERKRSRKSHN